ncbi:PfkB family carbohydrate kinase [Paracoccus saliphilus]|uniref:Fructoselysine 6-kinase n=1 Tax=Paracoccus saliphilus TaxID=405559 RepID=A0AA45W8I7_9RHOB|nr:PfkB family carbohydrate kinase [Paracoccus saliphilus]WCR02645.1 fructoselysine 6-kinase [Paracoccus saliphilus]SIT17193.1 fructoselysine 6-kinase [Paracoccus saliphilus]
MIEQTTNREAKLVAVGDNCLDIYVDQQAMAVGGNALNVAVQWIRQGWPARYFGTVGEDAEGEALLAEVAKAGLPPQDVERLPGGTAVTLIREKAGDRQFLLEDLGVGEGYIPSPDRHAVLQDADWVHLGTHSDAALVRRLVEEKVQFSIDVSTQPQSLALDGIPLIFASGPEAKDASVEPLTRALLNSGARKAMVTCGSRGAWFHDGSELHYCPAEKIEAVDTCGAGDSFIAAFLTAYCIAGAKPQDAMADATHAAARTCLHKGGFPQELRPAPNWLLAKYADIIDPAKER